MGKLGVLSVASFSSVTGVCLGILLSLACSDQTAVSAVAQSVTAADAVVVGALPDDQDLQYTGDLPALKAKGRLRILIPANIGGVFYLPRAGWPVEAQHEAAVSFAVSQGLEPQLIPVERFADMIPALLAGRGDIIAANLSVTDQRRKQIAFSVPLVRVRPQVLVGVAREDLLTPSDLAGMRVMADPSSSFWGHLQALGDEVPDLHIVARPPGWSDEAELDAVAAGLVDAALRDSNVAAMYLAYRDDLKAAFALPAAEDIAWGIRPDSPVLLAALNKFLHLEFLSDDMNALHLDGLDGIRQRRVLRILLRNNAASYFLHRGELLGFEYELARAFADAHKLRLEVMVPDTHAQLIDWLLEGRADIAAGFLEPDDQVEARGVAFSQPYHYAPRHLVVHAGASVETPSDLRGRSVAVRRSSPYWRDLQQLQAQGVDFELQMAADHLETEELIQRVAAGELYATVADGHLLDIELARGLPVKSGFRISDDRAHAVAVRAGNTKLLAALNDFIQQEYRGLVYNILHRKYFGSPRQIRAHSEARATGEDMPGLSPYDDIVREHADRYGFDWRLIVAQMFQESRFDPAAVSFAGAQGLMQVMPRTAGFMGFDQFDRPEDGIHAGVKYMDWVRNRFEPELPFNERIWFTLAAYNAGHGHVEDARRLARQKNLDGDRWFGNVEQAMLLLAKDEYASKARHGYVRGSEPVAYVRDIRQRYRAYVDISTQRLSQGAVAWPSGAGNLDSDLGRLAED